jgi:hypothetical protein
VIRQTASSALVGQRRAVDGETATGPPREAGLPSGRQPEVTITAAGYITDVTDFPVTFPGQSTSSSCVTDKLRATDAGAAPGLLIQSPARHAPGPVERDARVWFGLLSARYSAPAILTTSCDAAQSQGRPARKRPTDTN